jgi:quaternary ammonium compound-resistance protein SugE
MPASPTIGATVGLANPWVLLVVAGLLEIIWASTLKQTQGFTKLWPSLLTITAMVASFWLLSRAMKVLPAGTSYAVWVGIGAAGTALVAPWVSKEPLRAMQLVCVGLVVLGVVGLKVLTPRVAGEG